MQDNQFNDERQNKKVHSHKGCGFVVGSDGLSEEVTLDRELNEARERVMWTAEGECCRRKSSKWKALRQGPPGV